MKKVVNKLKDWAGGLPLCLAALFPLFASCSEQDDTVDEYADWQNRNEAYFNALSADAAGKQNANDAVWSVIRSYTKPADTDVPNTEYIVVERLQSGSGTTSPLFTDSVSVHYAGHLIPSASYPSGYPFQSSFSGTFDADVAAPVSFYTGSMVDGFTTALMHMHRGDHWRVYIPYQLGYGATESSGIPAYSTLIFEIRLVDFWSKKKGDRE